MMVKTIRSEWLEQTGRRLDCGPYMSGALEARDALERLSAPKVPLQTLTAGHAGGIYNGPQFRRNYVGATSFGVPFLSSGSMLLGDLSRLPLLRKRDAQSSNLEYLRLEAGTTLISCSGTIGRTTYVRPDMEGIWSSQDVMKVVPDTDKIFPGYLHAFLSSKYGVPLIVSGTFGSIIQHIEPEHISDIPVPRFGSAFEAYVDNFVQEAARGISTYQSKIKQTTELFFDSVDLQDISGEEWNLDGPDLGFSQPAPIVESLRALNFNPRLRKLSDEICKGSFKTLGEICLPRTLRRGNRFRRIDADPQHAKRMIGQRELFWLMPEGRWVAQWALDDDAVLDAGTIAVAARGTLGEGELYCRSEFVWGPWAEYAYSEDILRVIADPTTMPRGCLFAFMRSEMAFRMLRSISVGSKLQDHHYAFRELLPIPYPEEAVQQRIHNEVIGSYEARHAAVALLQKAKLAVEQAIGGEE